MSEIVNEAVIKVTADASGVESGLRKTTEHVDAVEGGLRRVEETAKKTGRTLENLSSGPGLRTVGEGAGAAAGQVDRSTKSMADSIQRATAAMSVGAKGSREYFESLANSRGINVAALRPYLDQLDAVTKKTALAAEAQRQLETSTRFLDGLRSQAEGIGKTAAQMATLRAEQLGVTDAARPLIEQLRAAEEAAGDAGGSFGDFSSALAAVGFGGGIAAISQISDQYGKYVSQLKLATVGQTEFANAQVAVRRIATSAQSDLSATGALYSSISKSTRELGLAQRQIADITETVSLALKVSGASGEEASSAILQLSQAFASGTLRGDEFNSVNEAAPRLMQALADGLGVPIGALRKMAEEGELTTTVLSGALPRALGELRNEALSVQTIGGAFTVLKNNVMEAVGATAQSSGVVKVFSGAIELLADNLTLAAGAMGTIVAVKLGTALDAAATKALTSVAANRALALSSLDAARANTAATAAASTLAAARVTELRAAVAATEGTVALAIATNGLIPAQARATAAAAAHSAAVSAQAAAMSAASVSGGLMRGALGLLRGPVGAVITLLGIGATAWALWGDSSNKAGDQVSESVKASTEEVLEGLDKQIGKLRERNRLASIGFKPAEIQSPGGEQLAEVVGKLDRAGRGDGEYANLSLDARTEILKALGKQYGALTTKISEFNRESEIDAGNRSAKSASEWMQKYSTNAEKMKAEIEKAKKDLGSAFTPELEARIQKQYAESNKGADKAADAYKALIASINEKIRATEREAAGLSPLTESQKEQIALDEMMADAKRRLSPARKAEYEADIKKLAANEALIASNKRLQASEALELKGKAAAEAELRSIADQVKAQQQANDQIGLTGVALAALQAARLEDAAAQKEQTAAALDFMKPGGDVAQTYRDQAAALRELAAAKRSGASKQAASDTAKQASDDWKRASQQIEQSLTDALLRGFESGKSIGENLIETLKNMFSTLVLRPVISAIVNPVAGSLTSALGMGGSAGGEGLSGGGALGAVQSATSIYKAFSGSLTGSIGASITAAGNLFGSSAVSAFGSGLSGGSSVAGAANAYAAAGNTTVANSLNAGASVAQYVPAVAVAVASYFAAKTISNGYEVNGIGKVLNIFGAVGGFVNRAFGMRDKEVTATGIRGSLSDSGLMGQSYTDWKQDGGWFRSDKKGSDSAALGGDLVKQFTEGFSALKTVSASFASSIGVSADSLSSYAKQFDIALGKDQAANEKAIADLFTQVGDEMANRLVPGLGQFSKSGEAASATLQRLAGDFKATDAMAQMLGKSTAAVFGSTGIGSATARERLIELAGGIDVLTQQASAYSQSFLTEAERLKPVSEALATAMSGLGLSAVASRAQFKQVIDSLNLTTEAGAKQYVAMMGLAESFALVHPAAEEASRDLSSYRSALTDAYNAESDALKQTVDRMGSFATSLRNLGKSALLGGLSPLSPQQKYAEARSQFEAVAAAARGGDEKAQDRYQDVYTAFLEASRLVNASSSGYQQDFSYAQTMTEEVARWAGEQVDVGQAQLDSLKASVTGIIDVNKSVLSVRDALLQYHEAMGKNTLPLTAVAPPVNALIPYSSYGTPNTEPLLAEIRSLNARIDAQTKVIESQTGQLTVAAYGSAEDSADRITSGFKTATYTEKRVAAE